MTVHAALPQLISTVHAVHSAHAMTGLALNPLSPTSILDGLGVLGVFLILFAETGLLIGFFLPGDSLLFTAGLFCTTGASVKVHLSLPLVLLAAVAGALLGAQVGFIIGQRAGTALLAHTKNRHLLHGTARAEELFVRYGHAKAIVLARFIPVVRTVLNPLAGGLSVSTRTFTTWQVAGGVVWSVGVTMAGYWLGSSIPGIDNYLLPIIAVIVIVSLTPLFLELRRARQDAKTRAGRTPEDTTIAASEQTPTSGL
jgi:membrane-associated protein